MAACPKADMRTHQPSPPASQLPRVQTPEPSWNPAASQAYVSSLTVLTIFAEYCIIVSEGLRHVACKLISPVSTQVCSLRRKFLSPIGSLQQTEESMMQHWQEGDACELDSPVAPVSCLRRRIPDSSPAPGHSHDLYSIAACTFISPVPPHVSCLGCKLLSPVGALQQTQESIHNRCKMVMDADVSAQSPRKSDASGANP